MANKIPMPCFHPLDARRSPGGTIGFKPMTPFDKLIKLPCGRCKGCRLERSRQTAVRLMHEAQLHQKNSFVTLTYNDTYLPTPAREFAKPHRAPDASPGLRQHTESSTHTRRTHAHVETELASLSRRDLQLFTKRLNQDVRRRVGQGVKYYACGEYGDRTHRPHYHIAIFGEDFSDDRKFWKNSRSGHPLWRSSRLARLWDMGDADIGDLTFESAAYIARYIFKKVLGTNDKAELLRQQQYRRTDAAGNDHWLTPEFNTMSRGGRTGKGLGHGWFEKYRTSVYPHDRVVIDGKAAKPPRYYDQLLEQLDQAMHDLVKAEREAALETRNPADFLPERLRAGEAILTAAMNQRKRPLE